MSDQDLPGGTPPPPADVPPPPPAVPTPPPPPSATTPPPPPAPGVSPPVVGGPADVGIRLGARVIDAVLLAIVQGVVTAAIIVPLAFSTANVSSFGGFGFGFSIAGFIISLIGVAIFLAYNIFLETTRGATLGKMLLGLEVRNLAGGRPTTEESFKRNAWYAVSVIPFLGGLASLAAVIYIAVTISQDPGNRGWHDQFSNTVVIKVK